MRICPAELMADVDDLTATLRWQGIGKVEVVEIENLFYAAREVPPH
jgi:hypothetical protein